MKKYSNWEITGFVLMMFVFVLYVLGIFIEIEFVSKLGNKLLFISSSGLLIWSLGRLRREKEQEEKNI